MAPSLPPVLSVTGIRGRNGVDAPHLVPDDQCAEAQNVEFYDGGLARKRNGIGAHGTTGIGLTALYGLVRHVPGASQSAAEWWGFFTDGIRRLAAGTAWAAITPSPADTFTFAFAVQNAISFNGKLFIAADNETSGAVALNRLHVWDGTNVRRVGLAPPTAASDGAKAAGAVTDVRKYKAAVTRKVSSVVVQRSELSPASSAITLSAEQVPFSLSGAPGEGETHWELYVASDDDNYATYRLISDVAIGNTISDNTADVTTLATFEPSAGQNQLPPSAKFLATDGNRILMAGAYESSAGTAQTTPKNNRVWFTPLLGTTSEVYYDDERISTITGGFKSWVDVGENDGDTIVGLGVIDGLVYVFKRERLYRLRPTGDAIAPYFVEEVSKSIGSVGHHTIFPAEDETGAAWLYFWSVRGPYRVNLAGLEYIGHDIEDIALSLDTSYYDRLFGGFYPGKRQCFWYMRTATDEILCFHTQHYANGRGGWSRMSRSGATMQMTCFSLFSNTPGASMSVDLKPWIGGYNSSGVVPILEKWDSGTYSGQAYVITKTFAPTQFREPFNTNPPTLIAETSSGISIQGILRADFHASTDKEDTVTLTAGTGLAVGSSVGAGTETRIVKRLDALEMAGMRAVAFQLGDDTAVSSAWTLDSLTIPWELPL